MPLVKQGWQEEGKGYNYNWVKKQFGTNAYNMRACHIPFTGDVVVMSVIFDVPDTYKQ